MKLKDAVIRNMKPPQKAVKLFDGGGLYLQVLPKGAKRWRFKYRFENKEKCLSLGMSSFMINTTFSFKASVDSTFISMDISSTALTNQRNIAAIDSLISINSAQGDVITRNNNIHPGSFLN